MVKIKAQVARRLWALTEFALLLLLLSIASGCANGPQAHTPPFRASLPPTPVAISCEASPHSIYPGDPITLTATVSNLDPKLHPVYAWAGSGVTGKEATATVNTATLPPGTYTVNCAVMEGKAGREGQKPWQSASSTATFTVRGYEPPAIACSANPSVIMPGGTSTITSVAVSPQNRPLTYTYTATSGLISSNGETATYSSAGAATGTVGVTCQATDDKGHVATADTTVAIQAPPAPPRPASSGYSCYASPNPVRPGDPVELKISPLPLGLGNSVQWNTAAGVLDSGVGTGVIDTSHLTPRQTVKVTAVVSNKGQRIGGCDTEFTLDSKAPVADWTTLDIVRSQLMPGQTEAPGFAVYTYILYRRKPVTNEEDDLFKNILAAIGAYAAPEDFGQHALESTAGANPAPIPSAAAVTPPRNLAEILVPVTESGDFTQEWLYKHYDPALAAELLSNLKCQTADHVNSCVQKLSGDGPYLVSTLVRLTGHPEAVLVQNLEGTSPEVGGKWVTAWMEAVKQKKNWTNAETMQMASMAFAHQLELLGGAFTKSQTSVTAAIGFFRMGQKQ